VASPAIEGWAKAKGVQGQIPAGGLGGGKPGPQKLKQYANLKGTKPS